MPIKIYKRGKIWHYKGTVAKRRLRGTTGATDKAIAQRKAAEIEAREWQSHLDGPRTYVTMAQAAIAYRRAEKPTRFLSAIENYWQDTPIKEISAGAIKQSAIALYPNVKAATRNRQVIVPTQAMINHAAKLNWCAPIKVERFKEDKKIKEPVTLEWVDSFIQHSSPHLGALCLFMFGTGARRGEAVALTWADIDLNKRTALIRQTKTGAERISHLPPPVFESLANIPTNRNPDDLVFKYANGENVYQVWMNAVERAGIKRLSPHCCRHGFATTMLHAGIDVKTVADLGGWKDVATVVKHYAHAMTDKTITNAIFDTKLTQGTNETNLSNSNKRINKI